MIFWWCVGYFISGITDKRSVQTKKYPAGMLNGHWHPSIPKVFQHIWSGSPRKHVKMLECGSNIYWLLSWVKQENYRLRTVSGSDNCNTSVATRVHVQPLVSHVNRLSISVNIVRHFHNKIAGLKSCCNHFLWPPMFLHNGLTACIPVFLWKDNEKWTTLGC